MNSDSWIPLTKRYQHGGEQPGDKCLIGSDLDITNGRIAEKLNILYPLAEVIENCRGAVEQRATTRGWLDPFLAAIEEAHADGIL
jgi:hypothetical protein